MKTLIIVETKKEYKQARDQICKQFEDQNIEHFINHTEKYISHENGEHRIDFLINKDKKSEIPQGARYNQIITWKKK